MKRFSISKETKLNLLRGIFYTSLLTANVLAGKLVYTGIVIFGVDIMFPSAVVAYAITFLMTDIIGEEFGGQEAKKTVLYGFIMQAIGSILILLGQFLPALDPEVQSAYLLILGQNWIFVIGSLVAYWASQSWDVFVFQKIRNKFLKDTGSNKQRWIWNNVSTATSQIIDTFLFIGIAFGLGFGWWFEAGMIPSLFGLMFGQYVIKFVIAVLDTPFFYLLTPSVDKNKKQD